MRFDDDTTIVGAQESRGCDYSTVANYPHDGWIGFGIAGELDDVIAF